MINQSAKARRRLILRFLDNFFASFWKNILPLYLMLAFGIFYFFSITPTYLSYGVLYLENDSLLTNLSSVRSNDYIWVSEAETVVEQFNSLMQTDAFPRAILQRTNWEVALHDGAPLDGVLNVVRGSLWGEIKGRKQVHIVAQSDDPLIAFQLADAAITLYRQSKVNLLLNDVNSCVQFFEESLETYAGELDAAESDLRTYLSTYPEPAFGLRRPGEEIAQIDILRENVATAERRILETRNQIDRIKLDQAQALQEVTDSYLLIDAPTLPTAPEFTTRQRIVVLFIFIGVGILLSIGAGVGATLQDKTYRFPLDIDLDLDIPVLGRIRAGAVAHPTELLGVYDDDPTPHAPVRLHRPDDVPPTLIILPE